MKTDDYLKYLHAEKEKVRAFYSKSINKTEQQKFLEQLLAQHNVKHPLEIADIAAGGGTLSFHINKIFPDAKYTVVDYNKDAIKLAGEINPGKNFKFIVDNIYDLKNLKSNSFDVVFCWQTLSWIANPENALKQLIRIAKPNGKIYLSSLFNIDFDVDIYSKVFDHSGKNTLTERFSEYNTYSEKTVANWLNGAVKKWKIFEFTPEINFKSKGRGIGTFTVKTETKKRIQISGGMLMNWGVLYILK